VSLFRVNPFRFFTITCIDGMEYNLSISSQVINGIFEKICYSISDAQYPDFLNTKFTSMKLTKRYIELETKLMKILFRRCK
jgi:hypothetical protein